MKAHANLVGVLVPRGGGDRYQRHALALVHSPTARTSAGLEARRCPAGRQLAQHTGTAKRTARTARAASQKAWLICR
jgi:hypothetical protein